MTKASALLLLLFSFSINLLASECYWQQQVKYKMDIDFNTKNHQFHGKQTVTYYNNSPDTLNRIFYHLYFNAFQPGSMMDIRSRTIADPDDRINDRIMNLKPEETGYHHIQYLKQDGKKITYTVEGTILEVTFDKPLLPGSHTELEMEFDSQVPVQIRRSGRNNEEGIAYSMSQWYPKIVEYDVDGWHANPYIGREFHGVWGDFDVTIHLDSAYTIGGTGYLQNPQEIGKGYEKPGVPLKLQAKAKTTWHFLAPQVHDFAWAADKNYKHSSTQVPNGPVLHFFHQKDSAVAARWEEMKPYAVKCFQIMNGLYGKYPYEQYSVIQAGDGGMEYPMATLIVGTGSVKSLVSVTVHESIHSWFQGALATNESKYAWMDEGFTSYAQHVVMDSLYNIQPLNPHKRNYASYFHLVKSGLQEPLSTHADHFNTNQAYGVAAYSMGCIFLHQLSYVIGQENLNTGLRRYFAEWKFKHPTPTDLKRIMEKTSGIELDWYFEYWIHSTKSIDYSIKSVEAVGSETTVVLERKGEMPMPVDLVVYLKNGSSHIYNIPMNIMRGHKPEEGSNFKVMDSWPWTYPEYGISIDVALADITKMEIDPTQRMADIERSNNVYPQAKKTFWGKLRKN